VQEELADVFAYAFLLSDKYNFDVKQIVLVDLLLSMNEEDSLVWGSMP
jgi:hypothetical protein